jgi:uncharacterized HAD superfamily protein
MKIGIDFDDVLAQTLSALVLYHNNEYGTKIERNSHSCFDLPNVWGVSKEECLDRLFKFYRSQYHKEMLPLEGVAKALSDLSKKHELTIITARPKEVIKETEDWLKKYLPNHKMPIHLSYFYLLDRAMESKGELCYKLGVDLFIDDSMTNIKDIASRNIPCLLLSMPWNKVDDLPKNVRRVNNWDEIVKYIYANQN